MANYKSFNDIILDMIDYLKLTQPNLDIKPNSVARDLFIDSQAAQVAKLYDALQEISSLQSVTNVVGQNLTNYGSNYSVLRQTGTKSTGTVVFTFRDVSVDTSIPSGSIVRTRNGTPFVTISSVYITSSQANSLRANAIRLQQSLYTAGINDEFAIEISAEAQSTGSSGNISKYSIISHNVPGVNSVTNVTPFAGGTNLESDSSFRSRILATFAGTNVGTANAYRSIVLGLAGAIDALVIEPGDPLMIRDGSDVITDSNGNQIVSSPGTGGKVDIYVMGENLSSSVDSFVYTDQSGTSNPTNSLNDYVIGLGTGDDTSLTLNSRRIAVFNNTAEVPSQPVSKITSVYGSVSGPNFVEQYLDSLGNLKGNYKLVKDTGSAGGSSFGLDKFTWTSDTIEFVGESIAKGVLNSVDGLAFTDVTKISGVTQDVQVVNENSTVLGASRNYVQVIHKPVRTVNRVYNLTTGERYVVTDQTPDDSDNINTTGRVGISGRTLPTASDVLQVDYVWIRNYNSSVDFDNFNPKDILNQSQDSIDWGYPNYIRYEIDEALLDIYGNLIINTTYNINRLLSIDSYISETTVVVGSSLSNIVYVSNPILSIHKIINLSKAGNPELYNTKLADGSFSNLVIILPSDSFCEVGDSVSVIYNLTNIAESDSGVASFLNNKITLIPADAVPDGTDLLVSYVANIYNLIPQTDISTLPLSSDSLNSFIGSLGYQPVLNLYSGTTVVSNQRRSPSQLRLTVSNIPNYGIIRFVGTTINRLESVFVSTSSGEIVDLLASIKKAEGVSSLSSYIYLSRVISVESGTMNAYGEFVSTVNEYDLKNYGLKNTKWDKENSIEVSTLSNTQLKLSSVGINASSPILTGTVLKIVFYYAKENDYEDVFFSRNGTLITNKVFGHITSVNRFYGMQDSAGTVSGKFIVDSANQPENNNSYSVNYDYLAPKENERITINYEYNKLITDATEAIENKRPITADILVKSATKIELDVEVSIVVTSAYINNTESVRQNVSDVISSSLNAPSLATTIDSSDIINNIYSVAGVDRVRIIRFNKHNESGTKLSLSAGKNEYFAPGDIIVNIEAR